MDGDARPGLPFLPHHDAFGWSPHVRSLETAVLASDTRWARVVVDDMDRDLLVDTLLVAVALLAVGLRDEWQAEAQRPLTDREMIRRWTSVSVRLAEAADAWDGEPVVHPFDVLEDRDT